MASVYIYTSKINRQTNLAISGEKNQYQTRRTVVWSAEYLWCYNMSHLHKEITDRKSLVFDIFQPENGRC